MGWTSGASGLCCLELQPNYVEDGLHLVDLRCLTDMADILAWVDEIAPASEPALIAVDAPTIIPNSTGMRRPDRLAHQHFGKYHAGCYPANLGRPFAERTTGLGHSLEQRGFVHAPRITRQQLGRYQIEVFPHAAMIGLFGLERILKYKKGRLAERKIGLTQLRDRIFNGLPTQTPKLNLTHTNWAKIPKTGKALKDLEDRLDSIICAYIAAYWWVWGLERNLVLGNLESGYIVVPTNTESGSL
ncbi:MAG: DUF429 domain-containing protein [Thainema sp.]